LLLERATASIERAELVASAAHSILTHGLQLHADLEALLKATIGAPFALLLVDLTRLLVHTRVELFVLDSSLEEALAAFTCQQAVVKAAHFVAAHGTKVVEAQFDVQRHVGRVNV
jgi:hypothetical protein